MREQKTAREPGAAPDTPHGGLLKRCIAFASTAILATGMTMTGAAPAQANDGEHRSHALAELVDVDALGLDALEAFTAEQNYVDDQGSDPDVGTIDASAIEQLLNVQLGGVSVPIDLGAQAGAASSYASTPAPNEATAASGLITSNGAIDVNGGEPYGYATVDLTDTLSQLGVSTDGVVDQLSLDLGALASTAQSVDGEVASSDYMIAGGRFTLDSPLVASVTNELNATTDQVGQDVNQLVGAEGPIQSVLDQVSTEPIDVLGLATVDLGSPTLNAQVDLAGVVDSVLGDPIVSESGAVTLDPSTGQVAIDIAALHGGNLNDLPANTELLSSAQIEQITTEINALLGELASEVSDAIVTAVEGTGVTLTFDPTVEGIGGAVSGDISVTIDTTLGQLIGGGEQLTAENINVEGSLSVLGADIPAGDILGAIAEPVLTQLVPTLAAPFAEQLDTLGETTETTLNEALSPVLETLSPVLESLTQVVSLTANAQESPGDLGETSFTVRALDVTVLPSVNAAALPLASSSVYSEAAPAVDPAISVAPAEVPAGDATTVDGTGFTPDSTATLQLQDAEGNPVGDPIEGVATDADGVLTSTELPVPEGTEPGEYTVVATDDTSSETAEAALTVTEADAPIDPSVTVDPTEVPAGDSTTVDGTSYTPDSTATVQLEDADGNPVGDPITAPTDENGNFTEELPVPEGTEPGDYTVVATDDETGESAQTPLTVTEADSAIDPAVSVDPTEVPAGDSTTVDGTGFTPDSTATVQLTGANGNPVGDPIEGVATDADGTLDSTDLPVPEGTEPGDYTVVVTDDETGQSAEATLTVTEGPGDGDADNGAADNGDADNGAADNGDADNGAADNGAADNGDADNGAADNGDADNGAADNGDADNGAADNGDADNGAADNGDADNGGDPSVTVDPDTAAPGEDVTVGGENFVPDSTVTIEVTDENGEVVDTIEDVGVDSDGNFTTDWTVPEGIDPGELTVTATDDSDPEISGSATLTISDSAGQGAGADGSGDEGSGEDTVGPNAGGDESGDDLAVTGPAGVVGLGLMAALFLVVGVGIVAFVKERRRTS